MGSEDIITIAGAKGGVGKTTTSINLGAGIAATGSDVVVVELDLAMANIVDFLSLPHDESDPTLHDVLAGNAAIEDAVYQVNSNFAVAPSGTDLEGYSSVDFDNLSAVLDDLRDNFDAVIVDTGAGLSRATIEPIRLADVTVLVSTPRVAAIRDVEKTKTLSERVDTDVCGLVLTKSGTGASPGPERIGDFLDVTMLGHVPEDEAVPSSQDSGEPVIKSAPDSDAAMQYRRVASNLLFRLDTAQSGDTTQPERTQMSGLSESTSQESTESTASEWMEETHDSGGDAAEPSQTESGRTAMSDGQGRSRYAGGHTTSETRTNGPTDDDSIGERETNAEQTATKSAITHVPEAAASTAAETEQRIETDTTSETAAESDSTDEERETGPEARVAATETRGTEDGTSSDSGTDSDAESETDSSGSSLTARIRSFVGRL